MEFTKNEGQYIVGCLESALEEAMEYEWETEYNDYWNVKNKYEEVCNEDWSCEYDFSNEELNIINIALTEQLQGLSEGDFEYIAINKIIDRIERNNRL